MPQFHDSEAREFKLLEPSDQILQVTGFNIGISTANGVTKGCEMYELELLAEGTGVTFEDTLYDHPKCIYRIDLFLKAAGVVLAKGENYEFREDIAREKGVRWVNPIGLRFHARVKKEPWNSNAGKPVAEHKFSNRVEIFYTDREKLAPATADDFKL